MNLLGRIVGFWYDFIVGDDWLLALGVVAGLALTGAAVRSGLNIVAWTLLPLVTLAVLALSPVRAIRAH